MDRQPLRIDHVLITVTALLMLPAGVQAAFWPQSFFDDFPLGRGWIAHGGDAFNEHLVRDVGALFLALVVASVWTALRRSDAKPIAAAWLVQGVLHLVYHAGHLDGLATVDRMGLVGSLVIIPVLAAGALILPRPDGATS